jgi:tetratricopeptide (TPR) repeat protein
MNLSKVYVVQKRYQDAVVTLNKVLARQPRHFEALNNLGGVYFQLNQYADAADAWKKAVGAFRGDTDAGDKASVHKYLGYSYYRLGRLQDAVDSYAKSLKFGPDDPDVLYNLGVADLDRGMYDSAAQAFEKAFAVNPSDSNAALGKAQAIDEAINEHMERGSSYMVNGEYSRHLVEEAVVGYSPSTLKTITHRGRPVGLDVDVEKLNARGVLVQRENPRGGPCAGRPPRMGPRQPEGQGRHQATQPQDERQGDVLGVARG